jgi:hypothetical protein
VTFDLHYLGLPFHFYLVANFWFCASLGLGKVQTGFSTRLETLETAAASGQSEAFVTIA